MSAIRKLACAAVVIALTKSYSHAAFNPQPVRPHSSSPRGRVATSGTTPAQVHISQQSHLSDHDAIQTSGGAKRWLDTDKDINELEKMLGDVTSAFMEPVPAVLSFIEAFANAVADAATEADARSRGKSTGARSGIYQYKHAQPLMYLSSKTELDLEDIVEVIPNHAKFTHQEPKGQSSAIDKPPPQKTKPLWSSVIDKPPQKTRPPRSSVIGKPPPQKKKPSRGSVIGKPPQKTKPPRSSVIDEPPQKTRPPRSSVIDKPPPQKTKPPQSSVIDKPPPQKTKPPQSSVIDKPLPQKTKPPARTSIPKQAPEPHSPSMSPFPPVPSPTAQGRTEIEPEAETTLDPVWGGQRPSIGDTPVTMKVVGVGGAGGNAASKVPEALNALRGAPVSGVTNGVGLLLLNTDTQALDSSVNTVAESTLLGPLPACNVLQLGEETLGGLGAGGVADRGRVAAEASAEAISAELTGADMVFVTAGMGGGTGSGAAPVVCRLAQEQGSLVVAVVTMPFAFEGGKRLAAAQLALEELKQHVDVLIVVPNDRLQGIVPDGTPLLETLAIADEVLRQGIVGVAGLLATSQLINVDFADVRAVMQGAGRGYVSIGRASGEDRAARAVEAAVTSPLLNVELKEVTGLVYSVVGGPSMSLQEVRQIGDKLTDLITPDTHLIFGAAVDEDAGDEIIVTLVATGFKPPPPPPPPPRPLSEIAMDFFTERSQLNLFEYRPPQKFSSQDEYLQEYDSFLSQR